MKRYRIILLVALLSILSGCKSDDKLLDESVIYVTQTHQSEFDKWIKETLTIPYNIEIKWKWDDGEIDNRFHVTPPRKEKAEQFMRAFYDVWIKPYEEVGGEEFIKTYVPKLIYLVGTAQYNSDGTKTLGLAEGGRKVTIFEVDEFDNTNVTNMAKSFHTLHHEFSHILHQKVAYSLEYKKLSKGNYTGAWYNFTDVKANTLGFITPYSMLNDCEDFVEVVATILSTVDNSNNPAIYNVPEKDENGLITGNIVPMKLSAFQQKLHMFGISIEQQQNGKLKLKQDEKAPVGLSIMLQKIAIIQEYYKTEWGIDLFELQGKIELAINKYIRDNQ